MLRMLVELVRNVASTFQMSRLRPRRDWHTPDNEAALPRMTNDTIKEPIAVSHDSPIALILSSTQSVRPSKDEGAPTTPSHTHQGSGPLVRVPREGGDPALLNKNQREARHWPPACAGDAVERV